MTKRPFYLTSFLTALIALILHAASHGESVQSSLLKSRIWKLGAAEKERLKAEAAQHRRSGIKLFYAGLASSLFSIACLIAAGIRKEPGW